MTNPDNIVRVRARNGGRASVYEANGWCQAYGSGILEGTGVVQNTVANMTVLVGGSSSKPDVLITQNPAGYKIALDLVGEQPVTITAPASNSRISAIVAYTDDLALESTEDTVTGSPASCGLIVVNGSSSASPSAPTDTQIRNAITADGATGSQASYAVIATITVASNATTITDSLITRNQAGVQSSKIDFTTLSENYLLWQTTELLNVDSGTYTLCEFTVQKAGTYALQGVIGGTTRTSEDYCMITVKKNEVSQHQAVASCIERGVARCDVPFYTVLQCSVGDKIKVEYSSPGTGIRAGTAIVAELLY